jgi:hypothetical protein
MLRSFSTQKLADEGYVYHCYGEEKYLRHVVASVFTLRRYDTTRPIALFCDASHITILKEAGFESLFDVIEPLAEAHASIVGFKHNTHHYMPFTKNLYLDSDMVWCRKPDALWTVASTYGYTITGMKIADSFFGGAKDVSVLWDVLSRKRQQTMRRFGVTYLSRVQSGMIYAQDGALTQRVNHLASESCEWSLALAMSKLNLPVYPWLQGQSSPQLDYIGDYTKADPDFHHVECLYYSDAFVYSFRGLKSGWLRRLLTRLHGVIPGKGDYMWVTPFVLHFGWMHQKRPFFEFADRTWIELKGALQQSIKATSPQAWMVPTQPRIRPTGSDTASVAVTDS